MANIGPNIAAIRERRILTASRESGRGDMTCDSRHGQRSQKSCGHFSIRRTPGLTEPERKDMNSQKNADRASVQSIVRRPGPGWRFVGSGVWDHDSGMRLHCLGLLVMPDGKMRRATEWPASDIAKGYIRVAGGNRKRGLMMWAMALLRIDGKVKRLDALFSRAN